MKCKTASATHELRSHVAAAVASLLPAQEQYELQDIEERGRKLEKLSHNDVYDKFYKSLSKFMPLNVFCPEFPQFPVRRNALVLFHLLTAFLSRYPQHACVCESESDVAVATFKIFLQFIYSHTHVLPHTLSSVHICKIK